MDARRLNRSIALLSTLVKSLKFSTLFKLVTLLTTRHELLILHPGSLTGSLLCL